MGSEGAEALLAALQDATGKQLSPPIKARPVGKRLQMAVGRPVAFGDGEVGRIARHPDDRAKTYRVKVGREDGR